MEKRRLKKLVINRETLRELSIEETRRVVGGAGSGSAAEEPCVDDCARIYIPVG